MVTNYPKSSTNPNIVEVHHGLSHKNESNIDMFSIRGEQPDGLPKFKDILPAMARDLYKIPSIKQLYENRKGFDLIIVDHLFNEVRNGQPSYHHHHHRLHLVHCRTKAFHNFLHSFLSAACLFKVTPTKLPISSFHLILCLPCLFFTIPWLPFYYSNYRSIICSSYDVSCPFPFFSFDCSQNVFNFGMFHNAIHNAIYLLIIAFFQVLAL